jgi:hypothetical protein
MSQHSMVTKRLKSLRVLLQVAIAREETRRHGATRFVDSRKLHMFKPCPLGVPAAHAKFRVLDLHRTIAEIDD